MKKLFLAFTLALGLSSAQAVTLQEAYKSALEVRASVANRKIDQNIAEQDRNVALSRVLPRFSASSQSNWLDSVALSGDTSRFSQSFQHTGKLTFEQPIFQGGGEYYGLGIAGTERDIARLEVQQEELDVFGQVANLYYELLTNRQDQVTFEEQRETLAKQVKVIRERSRIGRSRVAELLSAESRLARLDATLSQSKSEESLLESEFKWLTGQARVQGLRDPVENASYLLPDNAIERLLQRPEIRAEELRLESARKRVRVAQSGYMPTVDFSGNYYLDRDGILSGSEWDLTLFARWEFFSGLETRAEEKIAKLETRKIEIELSDLKRQRLEEFRGLERQFNLQKDTLEKLRKAADLAKRNVDEQLKEFERGLVDNLDVLEALENQILVRSALDHERFSAHLTWVRLQLLMGQTL